MKGKKLLFLFCALLLPVVIFIFLKAFGDNEFDVPVLHAEGVVEAPARCQFRYETPYRVADTVLAFLQGNGVDSLYVVYAHQGLESALNRVAHEFRNQPVSPVDLQKMIPSRDQDLIRECVLLMKQGESMALVDQLGRIRGYYDGSDRDEVDRLIVEIKIILKQY